MKILHIISSLNTGGAEMMLYKILSRQPAGIEQQVICLKPLGRVADKIKSLGVPVESLNLNSPFNAPKSIYLLRKIVKQYQPDLVQGWMYHANLFATISSLFSRRKIATGWSIRQTFNSVNKEKLLTRLLILTSKLLSKNPDIIIYNSQASMLQHSNIGYKNKNSIIINNGFDINYFRPSSELYQKFRVKYNIPAEDKVIGFVARHHPMKNHQGFLVAISDVIKNFKNIKCVLAGTNIDQNNLELVSAIKNLDLKNNIILLGETDAAQLFPVFDFHITPSNWGESFPNVIGEAMACGVPCIATDVGDSRNIIDTAGWIIPPNSPKDLTNSIEKFLQLTNQQQESMAIAARQRIVDHFNLDDVANTYYQVFQSIVKE